MFAFRILVLLDLKEVLRSTKVSQLLQKFGLTRIYAEKLWVIGPN